MSIIETRVGGRYKLKNKLGSGSFGDIYLAQNVQTREEVAVKLEDARTKYPQLIYEAKILHSIQGTAGIPTLHWCGQEGDYNVLVMELLGDNLETLLNLCGKKFTLKTVLMLVDQMLQGIEFIHNRGFLHRDIKPENLLMGLARTCHLLHFVDFGLSKRFRDPKTGKHIPYREGKQLTGTARYCSVYTHKGFEQSRRDDLEALGYVFVYLFKGSLPWQGMKAKTKQEKYNAIMDKKMGTPLEALCEGMPEQFIKYFEYCRRLKFEEKPDYTYLKRMFKELFMKEGFEYDNVFDWILIPLHSRYDINNDNVQINIEFSDGDNFVNNNLPDLNAQLQSLGIKSPQQHDEENHPNKANQDALVLETGKAQGKGVGNEYLRTELKSVENRNRPTQPAAAGANANANTGAGADNRAVLTRNPLYMKPQKGGEKKNNKDCNIF